MWVMLDANLLVLLIVGRTDVSLIAEHKRLRAYDRSAFELLVRMLAPYSRIMASPHFLAEASNLARQIRAPHRHHISLGYRAVMESIEELYRPSHDIISDDLFLELGLTDAGVLLLEDHAFDLLTDDQELWAAAQRLGRPAVKFGHWRGSLTP